MPDICDKWIQETTATLPDPCTPHDLVKAHIFNSHQNASATRKSYLGPPYLKIGGRIIYPRDGVIEWLKMKKGNVENAPQASCAKPSPTFTR